MENSPSHLPPVLPDVPGLLNLKKIWKQVQLDLIGKDVQDAITYSYVWIADQMGHIGLGWASSILCYWMSLLIYPLLPASLQLPSPFPDVLHHTFREAPYFWAVVMGTLVPLLIWAKLELGYLQLAKKQSQQFFPLDIHDLQWNVRTALVYFYLGIFWGTATLVDLPVIGFAVLFAVVIVAAVAAIRWIRQKMNLQQANIPGLFRLTNFQAENFAKGQDTAMIRTDLLNTIAFAENRKRLVVIAGSDRQAKTQLASGIATELLFNSHSLRYCDYASFREYLDTNADDHGFRNLPRWPWKETQALVLDGVAECLPAVGEQVDPVLFAQEIARSLVNRGIPHLQDSNRLIVLVIYRVDCDNERMYQELRTQLDIPESESLLIQTC